MEEWGCVGGLLLVGLAAFVVVVLVGLLIGMAVGFYEVMDL